LKKGSEINLKDKEGSTALHIAVEKGNYLICKILILDFNADITLKTKEYETALKIAIKGKDIDKKIEYKSIIELLKNDKVTINKRNNKNQENMIKFYGGNFKDDKYFIVIKKEKEKLTSQSKNNY